MVGKSFKIFKYVKIMTFKKTNTTPEKSSWRREARTTSTIGQNKLFKAQPPSQLRSKKMYTNGSTECHLKDDPP